MSTAPPPPSGTSQLDNPPPSQTCQQCHQPLLPSSSLAGLTPSQYSLIASSLPPAPSGPASAPRRTSAEAALDRLAGLPASSREGAEIWARQNLPGAGGPMSGKGKGLNEMEVQLGPGQRMPGGVAESFIMLGDSVLHQPGPSSHHRSSTLTKSTNPNQVNGAYGGNGTDTEPFASNSTGNSSSDALHLAQKLHALVSSRTPISHPLCVECTSILQSELQVELDELSRERDAYIAFEQGIVRGREALRGAGRRPKGNGDNDGNRDGAGGRRKGRRKDVEQTPGVDPQDLDSGEEDERVLGEYDLEGSQAEWDALQEEKKQLEEEERRLVLQLKQGEAELERCRAEEGQVREEEEEMDRQEQEFLLSHHALSTHLRALSHSLSSAQTQLLLSTSLLQHLESANVYNDAFHIGSVPLVVGASAPGTGASSKGSGSAAHTAGYVGTINGLRLGGRPIVDWDEINAAWGLVALCVDRMAARVGFTFEKYKIHPLGSLSRIDDLPPSRGSYELYASPDLASFMHNRRFSTGLVNLLDCIRQLVEFGSSQSSSSFSAKAGRDRSRHRVGRWPIGNIEIRKDRIGPWSIRIPGPGLSFGMAGIGLGGMSIMGLGSSTAGDGGRETRGGGGDGVGSAGGRGSGSGSAGDGARNRDRDRDRTADLTPDEQWTKACMAVLRVLKQILIAESEAEKDVLAETAPDAGTASASASASLADEGAHAEAAAGGIKGRRR